MTFNLSMSGSDLLLLLPELFLVGWLCLVLIVDFSFRRILQEHIAYLSIGGLAATLGILAWFDMAGINGTLFGTMFVVDRLALFFKIFVVGATVLVILVSIVFFELL
jgi:NADH-quinone oxidoreductase subunit N